MVYSSAKPADYLAEYAKKYPTVEVDQWFWSLGRQGAALPRPETATEYDLATPASFRFTVKCPNSISLSHYPAKKGEALVTNERFLDDEFFKRFLETIETLVPKIGLFIFQFEYLNKDKMRSKADFFEKLEKFMLRLPVGLPYAFEIRNPRWMDEDWFSLLSRNKAAAVFLQGYWMEDIVPVIGRHLAQIGGCACIRLHGDDRKGMEERTKEDWSAIVRPKDGELAPILSTVVRLVDGGRKVYLNVNNHFEGSAPLTIEKILRMLPESGEE